MQKSESMNKEMKHPDIWKSVNTTDNCKSKFSSIAREQNMCLEIRMLGELYYKLFVNLSLV